MTRSIEGRVVQLNWVSFEVFDHFFNAPKAEVLDLAPRFRHLHSQMLGGSFVVERKDEFSLFCVGFANEEASVGVDASHGDVRSGLGSRYLAMKPGHGEQGAHSVEFAVNN